MKSFGYIKTYDAGLVPLFLVSPLLSLPYILWGIYRRERSAYFFFSLFLGFLAWLQIPFADLFRHTINAYDLVGKPLSYIFTNSLSSDFFVPFVSWILVNADIPYQFLRLICVTESFFLMTIIFNYMIEKSAKDYCNSEIFIRFILLFLFFELVLTINGVRYGFAVSQYVFVLHLIFNKRSYFAALLFSLLAVEIHISFLFFIPVSIVLYYLCISVKRSIVILIVCSFLVLAVISQFSYLIGRRADWYFDGGTSVAGTQNITIYGFILFVGVRLFLLPFVVLVFKYFKKQSKWCRIGLVWIVMALIFVTSITVMLRMLFVFSTICVFLFLEIEARAAIKKRFVIILLWCGVITTIFNTVNFRTIILNSRYYYIAMPVPFILQNQYEKDWIIEHIDNNTIIKDVHE
ncbi:MAG TPA: EpsG family protein [Candidatus Avimuribaculum pullicola]|nr:EpsG family protein [Candidatus Avimuribaculum pullicola]